MIKIISLITRFILIVLTALVFTSCNQSLNLNSIKGSKNITTEKRQLQGNFKSIKVSNGIDLSIEQTDATEIMVVADKNLQKHILTKIENGILIITCTQNVILDSKSKKVYVKMRSIDQLQASSSSTITSKNTIRAENIELNTSSAAAITIEIQSDHITCHTTSASNLLLKGKALKLKTNASSGSEISSLNLVVNDVNATVSSGGSIKVHPVVSLIAKASSGGSITYNIVPKSIEKQVSSGGSIEQESIF